MKDKLCIVIKEIGRPIKEKGMENKIITYRIPCTIKEILIMINGKAEEFFTCLMGHMKVTG